jgi:hypothetical protein
MIDIILLETPNFIKALPVLAILLLAYFGFQKLQSGTEKLARGINIQNFKKDSTLTPSQLWAITTTANISLTNRQYLNALEVSEQNEGTKKSVLKMLAQWWDIQSREDVLETIEGLQTRGRRQFYADAWEASVEVLDKKNAFAKEQLVQKYAQDEDADILQLFFNAGQRKKYRENIPGNPFPSYDNVSPNFMIWDYSRVISLTRWGYHVGWLTEMQSWGIIMPAAKEIQKSYNGWEAMNNAYKAAKLVWNPAQYEEAKDDDSNLYQRNDSPFKQISWSTSLG